MPVLFSRKLNLNHPTTMPTTPQPEYTPYGPEWEKVMKRLPKTTLVAILRQACLDRDALRESLPFREKEGQQ